MEKTPHLQGTAICLDCKQEWEAVAPIGTIKLQCFSCMNYRGVWKNVCCPEKYWQCNCGCAHFFVNEDGCICCCCGLAQKF